VETIRPAIQPNLLFVRLTTNTGESGLGEAFFGARAVEEYIHETAARTILAMDEVTPEAAAIALRPYLGFQGGSVEVRGNAAIDLALWDLLGKETGTSLAQLLGGPVKRVLRTYNTCAGADYVRTTTRQHSQNWGTGRDASQWEDLDGFLTTPAELARDLLAEGITGMKVWPFDRAAERTNGTAISTAEMDAALGTVSAIRDAVGDRMDVMIELHGLWQVAPAVSIMRELAAFRPFWVEDPIRPDAVDAYTHLRRRVDVPIAAGETATGRRGFLPLLAAGVLDYATVDVQWSGGVTEARKVASLADAYGVPIAPHDCTGPATLAACAHLAASQPNGLIQETVRAFLRTWYHELVEGLPEIAGDSLTISDAPGHGVRLREGIVGESRVSAE
jgi:L-alanine-DL-glutamate epimerase-like enolase superfamily enzyme